MGSKIINEDWAKVGATGAITCSIIGIIVNLLTIYVIWARQSIRKQSLAPLLLLLAISDFLLSSIGVPIQAARYINSEWSLPEVSIEISIGFLKYVFMFLTHENKTKIKFSHLKELEQ